ncbi:MAG: ion channel [Pseudomonadota bacterium]
MSSQLTLGVVWTAMTMGIAVVFMVCLRESVHLIEHTLAKFSAPVLTFVVLLAALLWLLIGILAVTALWALLFQWRGEFADFTTAAYFSLISITTVGYGDITLSEQSRMLAGFAAADGFLIFGLYTAALFEVLSHLTPTKTPPMS